MAQTTSGVYSHFNFGSIRVLAATAAVIAAVAFTGTTALASASGPVNVDIHKTQSNNVEAASFSFNAPVQVKSFYLSQPDRFVIDFTDAVFAEKSKSIEVNAANITSIRIAQNQLDPDIVRVVFDLKTPKKFDVKADETGRKITVYESSVQMTARMFPKVSVNKSWDRVETRLSFNEIPQFERINENALKYALDFPNYKTNDDITEIDVNEGIVKAVRVSHYKKDRDITRFEIETNIPARVDLDKSDGGRTLVVSAYQSSLYGVKVTVDAGHGGKDPGAITDNGIIEKDIVLDVALRLRNLLESAGAIVTMTRDKDEFIELKDRAYIANKAGSDLFVSIHVNALPNHSRKLKCRGLQMFYGSEASEKFAETMLGQMIAALRTGEEGMFQRGFVVLKQTRMKAVLVELGFITHPNDAELLMNAEFRENAARGLFNGMEKYKGGRGMPLAMLALPPQMLAHLPAHEVENKYLVTDRVEEIPVARLDSSTGVSPDGEDGVFPVYQNAQSPEVISAGSSTAVKKGSPTSFQNQKYNKQP